MWHRHFGVYGICIRDNQLLVVHKTRGPYIHRYDLPGGSLNDNESIIEGLHRELNEEVGHRFDVVNHLGTFDYLIPWGEDKAFLHHIAVFYEVESNQDIVEQKRSADDSSGYEFVEIEKLTIDNASPLVLDIVDYHRDGSIDKKVKTYSDWLVLD